MGHDWTRGRVIERLDTCAAASDDPERLVVSYISRPDFPCRIAGDDCPWRDILRDHGTGANDCPLPDRHLGANKGVRTDPCIRADLDRRFHQRHRRVTPVVGSGAEMRTMRDGRTGANPDRTKGVENSPVPHGCLGSDLQVPGDRDADAWVDMHVGTDLCTEPAQEPSPKSPERARTESEQRRDHRPEHPTLQFPARPITGVSVRGDVDGTHSSQSYRRFCGSGIPRMTAS